MPRPMQLAALSVTLLTASAPALAQVPDVGCPQTLADVNATLSNLRLVQRESFGRREYAGAFNVLGIEGSNVFLTEGSRIAAWTLRLELPSEPYKKALRDRGVALSFPLNHQLAGTPKHHLQGVQIFDNYYQKPPSMELVCSYSYDGKERR